MDTHVTVEADMTAIEERIAHLKEQARMLEQQLRCECPSNDCQVEHES